MFSLSDLLASAGLNNPWIYLLLFLAASLVMIWRLEAMMANGLEGTVIGTLVMPYCSGLGNLIFVFLVARNRTPTQEIVVNCLVNNITNLTLLLGLPALIWGLWIVPGGKTPKKTRQLQQINRLSLLLTTIAGLFFTGAFWALGKDGSLNLSDGIVLIGLFLFWQCIHVFEVLKTNVRQKRTIPALMILDLVVVGISAWVLYVSINWLVDWVSSAKTGFFSASQLGWLSGWLMVLPNALLAFYYAWKKQPEVVFSSQLGDGHICIPLCLGLAALVMPVHMPAIFTLGAIITAGALTLQLIFLLTGGIPRWIGLLLVAAYGVFVYKGLAG